MSFKEHLNLEGKHAILGASKYHWLNYSDEKLNKYFKSRYAIPIGEVCHQYAADQIMLGKSRIYRKKLLRVLEDNEIPRNAIDLDQLFKTLSKYIRDAVTYQMSPEQPLAYSEACFGTADAISFDNNFLRIHDLKTGSSPASMRQLEIYASLFCLEYEVDPNDIDMELRIYQLGMTTKRSPEPEHIQNIMRNIIRANEQYLYFQSGR